MPQKALFVLTSHSALGDTGKPTGYYVPEAAHPWKILVEAGFDIDFASPRGGAVPAVGHNLEDPVQREFLADADVCRALANSLTPADIDPDAYAAIHYVGGHGAMWDLPDNSELTDIAAAIYAAGGSISAVCHGLAGLINVTLADGSYLVEGRAIACFTDDEERAVGLADVVPFLLETRLRARGAKQSQARTSSRTSSSTIAS